MVHAAAARIARAGALEFRIHQEVFRGDDQPMSRAYLVAVVYAEHAALAPPLLPVDVVHEAMRAGARAPAAGAGPSGAGPSGAGPSGAAGAPAAGSPPMQPPAAPAVAGAASPAQAPAPAPAAAVPVREVAINHAPLIGGKYESSTPPTLEMLRAWRQAHPGDKQQGLCFDFWRRGFCVRGSTCRYQHQGTT